MSTARCGRGGSADGPLIVGVDLAPLGWRERCGEAARERCGVELGTSNGRASSSVRQPGSIVSSGVHGAGGVGEGEGEGEGVSTGVKAACERKNERRRFVGEAVLDPPACALVVRERFALPLPLLGNGSSSGLNPPAPSCSAPMLSSRATRVELAARTAMSSAPRAFPIMRSTPTRTPSMLPPMRRWT